jgi:predicted metal-dependent enzyme (double-stranded beta helix superfamily)
MPTRALRRYCDQVTALADRCADLERLALGAADLLRSALDVERLLDRSQLQPDPDHYRQHIVHVDPHGRFSVVILVWLPGQATPIHDHVSWCVTGVYQGQERERRFELAGDGAGLHPVDVGVNDAGAVSHLVRPDREIHQVSCTDAGPAVSLHVYGADIARLGSSIDIVYPERLVLVS